MLQVSKEVETTLLELGISEEEWRTTFCETWRNFTNKNWTQSGGLFPLKGNLGDHGAFNTKDLTLIENRFLFDSGKITRGSRKHPRDHGIWLISPEIYTTMAWGTWRWPRLGAIGLGAFCLEDRHDRENLGMWMVSQILGTSLYLLDTMKCQRENMQLPFTPFLVVVVVVVVVVVGPDKLGSPWLCKPLSIYRCFRASKKKSRVLFVNILREVVSLCGLQLVGEF